MSYILDSGFLYALSNRQDQQHQTVTEISQRITEPIILPAPVITEAAYLIARDLGYLQMANLLERIAIAGFILDAPRPADLQRAAAVVRQYADAEIDFVDAIIVATAERLNITRLLTLDQRDFRLIRPRHCVAFELLP